jgi:hypothetical protein
MFLTYSVFHGGFVHFLVNMITLLSLGAAVSERGGTGRYAAIYVGSILGGAASTRLLAPGLQSDGRRLGRALRPRRRAHRMGRDRTAGAEAHAAARC